MNLYWPSAPVTSVQHRKVAHVHWVPSIIPTTLNEGVGGILPSFYNERKARHRKIQQVSRRDRDLHFCVNSIFFCTFLSAASIVHICKMKSYATYRIRPKRGEREDYASKRLSTVFCGLTGLNIASAFFPSTFCLLFVLIQSDKKGWGLLLFLAS